MTARTLPQAVPALTAAAGLGLLAALSAEAALAALLVVAVLALLARRLRALPALLVLALVAAVPASGVSHSVGRAAVLAALGGLALQSARTGRVALRPGLTLLVALAWGGWVVSGDA